MIKLFNSNMIRATKIIDLTLKNQFHLCNDFKILGLKYPSSRFKYEPLIKYKKIEKPLSDFKCVTCNTSFKVIKPNLCKGILLKNMELTECEKIIGLDFPNSRFN
jgi:hypothetical protein